MAESSGAAWLAGRRGLVVGISGANSIGYRCAVRLSALGAAVAVTYRPARSDACRPLMERAGIDVHHPLDSNDEPSVAEAVRFAGERLGGLDFLVHTIVHVPEGALAKPLVDLSREDFRVTLDSSAYSLVLLARHAVPWLRQSDAGRIVAIGSGCATRMTPNYHVAGIGKAALHATVLYLAQELGPLGILCNVVSPSLLATDGAVRAVGRQAADGTRAHLAKRASTRRAVEHDDVSDAVAWLSSPLCRNVTAEVLTIDGGFAKNYF